MSNNKPPHYKGQLSSPNEYKPYKENQWKYWCTKSLKT